MRRTSLFITAFLLGACITQPAPGSTPAPDAPFVIKSEDNLYAPRPQDTNLKMGGVVLTSLDLAEQTDLAPLRIKLNMLGLMPRACNELRINVSRPNEQYQILVKVYSLVDPEVKCENVFQQFEASVLLGLYSSGRYTVWVNNELVGDFVVD